MKDWSTDELLDHCVNSGNMFFLVHPQNDTEMTRSAVQQLVNAGILTWKQNDGSGKLYVINR